MERETAARLVTAPPIPTTTSGAAPPSSRARSSVSALRTCPIVSDPTGPWRAKRSVYVTEPTGRLNCSRTLSPRPKVNSVLPPPVSKATRVPVPRLTSCVTARKARRLSSSPGITSTGTRARPSRLLTAKELFPASRKTAVPTTATASTSLLLASATMATTARMVLSSGSGWISPVAFSPSPRRVSSARSTTRAHDPSGRCSPMWNFTELVPMSMTA